MIKYAIVVPGVPDKDGQFAVSIRITKQDEDQVAINGCGNLAFRATNGWSVLSTKNAVIDPKRKIIAIMGAFGTGTYTHSVMCHHKANEDTAYLDSLEEANKVKEEIVNAINEWVLNGGFDKIQVQGSTDDEAGVIQDKFLGEYSYQETDYYE